MRASRSPAIAAWTILVLTPWLASRSLAQTPTQAEILERLDRLERNQVELEKRLEAKDARIDELESELDRAKQPREASVIPEKAPSDAVVEKEPEHYGEFTPGGGFRVAKTKYGDAWLSAYAYVRYLNQKALDKHYTDDFGREFEVDRRNDAQVNKAIIYLKGWVYDPDFRYLLYTWSANTSQGQGAQVVVAGNLSYHFNDALTLGLGIGALPTSRTNRGSWPYLLKVDHRTIADEFFRGSYTTGIWSEGTIADGLKYKIMLGNNLSQLGVDAGQMDSEFSTVSGSLWWMPTTGEFGTRAGYGDFDYHEKVASTLGLQFTYSPETKQSQPGQNDPDNSQIRLSDGTRIFSVDAFGPGFQVDEATYRMTSFDAGVKYRGWALEGEYYWRWLNDFSTTGGPLPNDDFFDHGFQLQASTMLLPKTLQLFATGSTVFGEYGDPWDTSVGLNWFPFKRQQLRVASEVIYLDESPVGYASIPLAVGGKGPVFHTNLELYF